MLPRQQALGIKNAEFPFLLPTTHLSAHLKTKENGGGGSLFFKNRSVAKHLLLIWTGVTIVSHMTRRSGVVSLKLHVPDLTLEVESVETDVDAGSEQDF